MTNQNEKAPLTHVQKIARGYEAINLVGGVQLYLTPGDLARIKRGIVDRAKLIAYKVEQETSKQVGTAEQNAPMVFEITPAGKLRCKQTGTRNWLTLSKAKLREMLDRRAELEAIYAKLPDAPVVVAGSEDEE